MRADIGVGLAGRRRAPKALEQSLSVSFFSSNRKKQLSTFPRRQISSLGRRRPATWHSETRGAMRDDGGLKGASRSRRGVVGVLLLVGVVVAAAALLGPSDASDDDASTSSGVTLAKGAAAWARATERPDARVLKDGRAIPNPRAHPTRAVRSSRRKQAASRTPRTPRR